MNLTLWVLLLNFIFLIIFDYWIIKKAGKEESISAYVIRFYYKNKKGFLIGVATGCLLGHFFWSMKTDDVYKDVECKPKMELTKE